jgi:tetratricopeptide (TPR) repeat protein
MGALVIEKEHTSETAGLAGCSNETRTSIFVDKAIEALLVVLFFFMPFSFGAVQAWSEEFVIVTAGLIAVLFCSKLILLPQVRLVRTWAYIPVAVFLLITAVQLLPLPKLFTSFISPNAVALRMQLLRDIPGSSSYLSNVPLSLYPAATKHDLRLLLSAAAVFVVVLNVFRSPAQIKRLLWWIALIGGLVAAITLAQNILGNGKIYWFISTPNSKGYSGPFINHSNYGQFMNLSIAAALAVLIVRLGEVFSNNKVSVPRVFDYIGSSSSRAIWLLICIISMCLATVFLSLTRGGIISMLASMVFTVVVLARTGPIKRQWWLFCLIFLLAFSCVLYAGFDAVCERLATLRNLSRADSGRVQILKDIAVSSKKFPLVGTGLGTYKYVYPMFDRSYIVELASHAENEYAEALAETGLLGLATLLTFGVIISRQYLNCIGNKSSVICKAAYGIGFGITAILIHSLVDFGQHIPANGFLTVAFCAILIVLSKQGASSKTLSACRGRRWVRVTAAICIFSIWSWAVGKADGSRIAERHWNRAQAIEEQLTKTHEGSSQCQYARLLGQVRAAIDSDPENVKYLYWLSVYKYRKLGSGRDPYSEVTLTQPEMVQVHDIVNKLRQVCLLCPTYGEVYSMVGQIEKYVLSEQRGSENIRRGFRLAKNDPVVCFVAACSDASEGDIDSASEKFARAVKLDGRLYKKVAMVYVDRLSRPDLAIEAAGQDPGFLYQAFVTLSDAQYTDYAEQAQRKIITVLREKYDDGNIAPWECRLLGSFYGTTGENRMAIECYRRALRMKYDEVEWRFELANLLAKCNNTAEAMAEARVCLQLNPQCDAAKNLLAQCSVRPVVLKQALNQN